MPLRRNNEAGGRRARPGDRGRAPIRRNARLPEGSAIAMIVPHACQLDGRRHCLRTNPCVRKRAGLTAKACRAGEGLAPLVERQGAVQRRVRAGAPAAQTGRRRARRRDVRHQLGRSVQAGRVGGGRTGPQRDDARSGDHFADSQGAEGRPEADGQHAPLACHAHARPAGRDDLKAWARQVERAGGAVEAIQFARAHVRVPGQRQRTVGRREGQAPSADGDRGLRGARRRRMGQEVVEDRLQRAEVEPAPVVPGRQGRAGEHQAAGLEAEGAALPGPGDAVPHLDAIRRQRRRGLGTDADLRLHPAQAQAANAHGRGDPPAAQPVQSQVLGDRAARDVQGQQNRGEQQKQRREPRHRRAKPRAGGNGLAHQRRLSGCITPPTTQLTILMINAVRM